MLRIPTQYNSLKKRWPFCIPKESDRLGHSSTMCVQKYYVQWSEITQFYPVKFLHIYFSIPCGVCGGGSATVTCFSLRTLFSPVSITTPLLSVEYPGILLGGWGVGWGYSTNSVEDRRQGSGGGSPLVSCSGGRNFVSYSKFFLCFGNLRLFMMTTIYLSLVM